MVLALFDSLDEIATLTDKSTLHPAIAARGCPRRRSGGIKKQEKMTTTMENLERALPKNDDFQRQIQSNRRQKKQMRKSANPNAVNGIKGTWIKAIPPRKAKTDALGAEQAGGGGGGGTAMATDDGKKKNSPTEFIFSPINVKTQLAKLTPPTTRLGEPLWRVSANGAYIELACYEKEDQSEREQREARREPREVADWLPVIDGEPLGPYGCTIWNMKTPLPDLTPCTLMGVRVDHISYYSHKYEETREKNSIKVGGVFVDSKPNSDGLGTIMGRNNFADTKLPVFDVVNYDYDEKILWGVENYLAPNGDAMRICLNTKHSDYYEERERNDDDDDNDDAANETRLMYEGMVSVRQGDLNMMVCYTLYGRALSSSKGPCPLVRDWGITDPKVYAALASTNPVPQLMHVAISRGRMQEVEELITEETGQSPETPLPVYLWVNAFRFALPSYLKSSCPQITKEFAIELLKDHYGLAQVDFLELQNSDCPNIMNGANRTVKGRGRSKTVTINGVVNVTEWDGSTGPFFGADAGPDRVNFYLMTDAPFSLSERVTLGSLEPEQCVAYLRGTATPIEGLPSPPPAYTQLQIYAAPTAYMRDYPTTFNRAAPVKQEEAAEPPQDADADDDEDASPKKKIKTSE